MGVSEERKQHFLSQTGDRSKLKIVSVISRASDGCDRSHAAGRTNKQTRSRSVTLSNKQLLEKKKQKTKTKKIALRKLIY